MSTELILEQTLSAPELQTFLDKIRDVSSIQGQLADLGNFQQLVEYKGFDAEKARNLIAAASEGNPQWIMKAIVLAVERGTRIENLTLASKARMSGDGVTAAQALKVRFKLRNAARSGSAGAMSLARIMLAYPEVTVTYARERQAIPFQWNHHKSLTVQAFAALIPNSGISQETDGILVRAHILAMYKLSMQINTRFQNKTFNERKNEVANYIDIGRKSKILNSDKRKEYLEALGVLNSSYTPTETVKSAAEEWEKLKEEEAKRPQKN